MTTDPVSEARQRALHLLDAGDLEGAFDELAYALVARACPGDAETVGLGVRLRLSGRLNSEKSMRPYLKRMGLKNTPKDVRYANEDS